MVQLFFMLISPAHYGLTSGSGAELYIESAETRFSVRSMDISDVKYYKKTT
jgi:hypothetical protein